MKRRAVLGIMLAPMLMSMLTLAFNIRPVRASETIYIRADGSIDPSTAPIQRNGDVYTFTNNITDSIVVQKNNIIIDGVGKTVQGTGEYNSRGIDLSNRVNVTVRNTRITAFHRGVYLTHSSTNNISGNNITNNEDGIWLYDYSSNNSISGNNITANKGNGVWLYSDSYSNSITANNITGNNHDGVMLRGSSNKIDENNIRANNGRGIWLSGFSNNISGNNITNNEDGITIYFSSNNNITGNNITANNEYGIHLVYSSYSSNNSIFHNNLIDNIIQVYVYPAGYTSTWDDGYPSGGNYWSDYTGVDTDGDGIGNTQYTINTYNRDRYPLLGRFNTFDIGTWNGETPQIHIVSDSTVSNFHLNTTQRMLGFNVTGVEGKAGFCRVTIPNIIAEQLWHGNYSVLLNGQPWPFRNWTDTKNAYIYMNYPHSEHEIIIIPEFPSAEVLPLLMALTMLTVAVAKRRKPKI